MFTAEKKEKIRKFILELQEENNLIIVEGKNDSRSLNNLGIRNCIELNGPIYRFVESLSSEKRVILLLDTDKEGKKLTKKLVEEFQKNGIKPELKHWIKLISLKISHVQGLYNMVRKFGGN